MSSQDTLMKFDPATGWSKPYPSQASQWRAFNGSCAWLFNPWTGERRAAEDVGSDTFGYLIRPGGELLVPAQETTPIDSMSSFLYPAAVADPANYRRAEKETVPAPEASFVETMRRSPRRVQETPAAPICPICDKSGSCIHDGNL